MHHRVLQVSGGAAESVALSHAGTHAQAPTGSALLLSCLPILLPSAARLTYLGSVHGRVCVGAVVREMVAVRGGALLAHG